MNTQLKKTLRRFYAFQFLSNFHFFGAVLIPFYTQWAGMSESVALWLQTWFAIWLVIFEIPTGFIADKFGRRNSILLGNVIAAIGFLLYGSIKSLFVFGVGELLLALAVALVSGADEAWLYETLKQYGRQDLMQSIHGKARGLAMIGGGISALIGGYIGQYLGLNMPMMLSSLATLAVVAIVYTFPEPSNSRQSVANSAKEHIAKSFKFFTSTPRIKRLTFNLISLAVVAYFVIWLYQPILLRMKMPIGTFGYFHVIFTISEAIIFLNFSFLSKLAGTIGNYMRLSAALTAFGFFLVAVFPNLVTLIIFLVIAGGFGLTRLEFAKSHFHHLIKSDEQRATIGSSLSFFRRSGIALANLIVGFSLAFSLHYTLLVLAAIAAAIILLPFPEQQS